MLGLQRHAGARAFTLVELVVVVVLVGILAGLIVPRLVSTSGKQSENEAETLRLFLTQLAERASLSGELLAVDFDPAKQQLGPLAYRSTPAVSGAAETVAWVKPGLVRPVTLAVTKLAGVSIDGRRLPPGTPWRFELGGSTMTPRGVLSLSLAAETAGSESWQVDLLPGEFIARKARIKSQADWRPSQSRSVDLDAQGRRADPW